MEAPIRYQRLGDDVWNVGTTVNVSRSGVLFDGPRVLPAGTALRAVLTLPNSSSEIVCAGYVVRVESGSGRRPQAMAAAVECESIRHLPAPH